MPAAPKATEERLSTLTAAWEKLAPEATFGGMTLAQFKAAVKPSADTRKTVKEKETELGIAINDREDADKISMAKADLVVKGVVGDTAFGDDSSLYEEMGYVRKSERRSGLTRKKKTPPVA